MDTFLVWDLLTPRFAAVRFANGLLTRKIVKKRVKAVQDRYTGLKTSWRRPKGIYACVRRKWKGCTLMPSIGCTFLQNRIYSDEIAHNMSTQKRKKRMQVTKRTNK